MQNLGPSSSPTSRDASNRRKVAKSTKTRSSNQFTDVKNTWQYNNFQKTGKLDTTRPIPRTDPNLSPKPKRTVPKKSAPVGPKLPKVVVGKMKKINPKPPSFQKAASKWLAGNLKKKKAGG